jgi:glutamate synthase domain-containing protein 2/glutamate synthase domain-containing protein 1/glutamate synthase domain-containing protein 3
MKTGFRPQAQGLYDPSQEHDSCGVGFVANIKGVKSHDLVANALQVLVNLTHRGAAGSDPETGDGAGIIMQLPDLFLRKVTSSLPFDLPASGEYGVGMMFMPIDAGQRQWCEALVESIIQYEGQQVLGWRDVPNDDGYIGRVARSVKPFMRQVFIKRGANAKDQAAFERKLYVIRKVIEKAARAYDGDGYFYIPSFSSKTIIYKGLLLAEQVGMFYPDLSDPDMTTALAIVHQRYSTNTFPTWDLAHPFRYLAHNGEINTLRGNMNWMHARQSLFESELYGDDIKKLFPVCIPGASDSATLDNALELLVMGGRPLDHAVMMLIPEAWSGHESMSQTKKDFYEYHSCMMEPWDGPASVAFTDGVNIGATLDRNGLRPSRYVVTKDDMCVMASEVGVLDIAPENVKMKGRLQPGRMFLIDTVEGRIVGDEEIKENRAQSQPYGEWLSKNRVVLGDLAVHAEQSEEGLSELSDEAVLAVQQTFGYTDEDQKFLLIPMARDGQEPTGSMGNDTPLAVLSDRPQLLYNYFKQLFAQVTNPPIDPIREDLVMSLVTYIGGELNLLDQTPEHCNRLQLTCPILTNEEMSKIKHSLDGCVESSGSIKSRTLSSLFPVDEGKAGLEKALDRLCEEASLAVDEGIGVIVLSDRGVDQDHVPIPALLACSGVHHHLIREGTRTHAGIVVESGEPREVMHFALLAGYGAGAINPYVAMDMLGQLVEDDRIEGVQDKKTAVKNYVKAIKKGLLKVFSKMGICTLQSYQGAQIFEAIGLSSDVINKYFTGSASRLGGIPINVIATESLMRHQYGYPERAIKNPDLDLGGAYQWRRDGEHHMVNPDIVAKLQHAVRTSNFEVFKEYSSIANNESRKRSTIRGMLQFQFADKPLPLEEVEPESEIVKRFVTGAMSFGSISKEAHENLAIAMNRLGGKSNTGEGGEDPERFKRLPNGDSKRSAIKQVASGRFGVTNEYLTNADELQIKMAQGAKPGEGGQLPGHKVNEVIAKVRHSTPGVTLISPPPHHDIYSIEDLAQLIHDLKNANPKARISVKLVSEVGVGTVAAGVSKGKADHVLVSGDNGGTGASPLSSIKHAGLPWELGLSETQQVLVKNDLRSRIVVQTDGQMKTGRDVIIAGILGAEEVGFATLALVASGCIMMRKCHLNTCPVGVATQNEELRKLFTGKPEHVVNFFTYIAKEAREIMAKLGVRKFEDLVGCTTLLAPDEEIKHWKGKYLDLSKILEKPDVEFGVRCMDAQDHGLDKAMDNELIELAHDAIENKKPVEINLPIRNINRTVATTLSHEITKKYGIDGLPEDTLNIKFSGSAGQSFGAFLAHGVNMTVEGDANDYTGKGMTGGRIVVYPSKQASFVAEDNILVGNVVLYGATGGDCYFRGVAGERFCVRNSGARAVVEGVGDHGCEYMTGGRVVVLGEVGRNFGAGMSGGIAYIYDKNQTFAKLCNHSMIDLDKMDDPESIAELRGMIERHQQYTDSSVAQVVLDNWDQSLTQFVKVMPKEYKRYLMEIEKA